MTYCPNCGSQVEGKFCAKCGSPVAADPAPGGAAPTPAAVPAQSAGMTDNMAAALCYLLTFLTGILFLVLEPYNKNKLIRFHAFQSIFFGVAYMVVWIVVSVLGAAMTAIPFVGWFFTTLLYFVLLIGFFVLWLMLMYKAYNNEKWVLPVIGPLAEKQA